MNKRIGKRIDQVARDEADLAVLIAGDVTSQTVDISAKHGRLERGQPLPE